MASESAHVASGGGSPPTERTEGRDHASDAAVDNDNNVQHDNSSDDDHVRDEKAAPGPTKWQKVKSHFWRFKWWYLLALAVLLAILLPLMFTVIIPAIIQNVLNGQKLPIKGGTLQALSPDRLNMSVDTSLKCPIGIHLNPLNLSMFTENATSDQSSSFLTLRFPGMHVEGTTEVNLTEQTLPVTNQTELLLWFNDFFDKPKVKVSLRGKPRLHLASLKYTRDLDKTIEVPSLNYLDGFGVKSLSFNMNNDTKYNMKGVLNIPNSGVLTLGLGNMTWNILSGNVNLGLINLYNLTLYPGNNSVPLEGNFFFNELVPNLKTILDDQKGPLGNGYVELFTSGNTTVVDGVHIPYLEGVLNRKRVRFTIPVITLLGDVIGGILDDKDGSLLDVFGEAIGNRTLFENVLDHWNTQNKDSNKDEKRDLFKRAKGGRPWMLNLLRLGARLNKV